LSPSFVAVTRGPDGKQQWVTIGAADVLPIAESRQRAREIIKRVQDGLPAIEPRGETFAAIVANWRKRHVEKNGLRSAKEIVRLYEAHILPAWRDRELTSIRRSDIAALLDHVEDEHGARQADYCLNVIRSLMNWYAARNDNFNPPIVRGMRRQSPHAQARSRVLTDDELKAIWKAAESAGAFGAAVRLCLLTAQRRAKVLRIRWDDISAAGEWTIPKEPREKDTAGVMALPGMALSIIRAQSRFAGNPFVLAGQGKGAINGISKFKARLDKAAGVSGWRLHDLRRTARSLMSRAGVPSDHAERVMGHAIGGVEGTYDRHSYRDEKSAALAQLATLIGAIVAPHDKVVAISKGNRR
jgi:integrase